MKPCTCNICFLASLLTLVANIFPNSAYWDDCDDGQDCESGYVCDDDSYGTCYERYPDAMFYVDLCLGISFMLIILWCIKNVIEFANKSVSNVAAPAIVPANSQEQPKVGTQSSQAQTQQVTTSNKTEDQLINTWYDVLLIFPFETTCKNYLVKLVAIFGAMGSFLLGYLIPTCCDDYYDSDWGMFCIYICFI